MFRVSAFRARKNGIVRGPRPSTESRAAIVFKSLLDFGSRVHDKRAVLHNRFSDRPALQKQELALACAVLQRHFSIGPKLAPCVDWNRLISDFQCVAVEKIKTTRAVGRGR